MITIQTKVESAALQRRLSNIVSSQMPYATALAINSTLKTLHRYNQALMKQSFSNPVPYTLNAFYITYAKKDTQVGSLQRKDKPAGKHYLEVQSKGGQRPRKGFENNFVMRLPYKGVVGAVLPTENTPVNSHGVIPMSFLNKVMSQLQIQKDSAQNTGYKKRTGGGRRSRAQRYFVPEPSHPLAQRGGPGVYATKPDALGKKRQGSRVTKVLNFTDALPMYQKRYDFDGKLNNAANTMLTKNMRKAIIKALSSAR